MSGVPSGPEWASSNVTEPCYGGSVVNAGGASHGCVIARRWDANAEVQRRVRAQHVAGGLDRRNAVDAGDAEGRVPRACQQLLGGIGNHRHRSVDEWEVLADRELGGRRCCLLTAVVRDLHQKFGQQHAAVEAVLDAVEQFATDPERRRHHSAGLAAVYSLGEDVDAQRSTDQAAQRSRHPPSLVVEASGVEAQDEARRADPVGERVEVCRQVGTTALLACFDQHEASVVAQPTCLRGFDREDRREGGIAVVRAAAAIQAVAVDDRLPRAEVVAPSGHLRLLVEVAVEQDRVVGRTRPERWHLHQDHGCATGQLMDLDRHSCHGTARAPRGRARRPGPCDRVRSHFRVVQHRHVRDLDVVVQRRNDLVAPHPVDVIRQVRHRRTPMRRSMACSASATMAFTRSAAGTNSPIAPTPVRRA
jgi:hypothetical protein